MLPAMHALCRGGHPPARLAALRHGAHIGEPDLSAYACMLVTLRVVGS